MYNNHFKPPSAYPPRPRRSPSPPNSFIEPLSPAKPTPIEPNFNYPAINNNVDFTVHAQTAQTTLSKAEDHGARRRRGHVKTPSTIDALADAALALSPSFNSLERGSSLAEQQVNGYGFARRSHHAQPTGEPPHKRARSEAQPSDFARSHGARPATSYETIRWANAGHHLPAPYSHERRVEEAALLLNFSTTGGSPLATLTPLAPAAGLSATPRPHANSFPRDPQQQRPDESILKASLLPPFDPQNYILPPPVLPSPQRTSEGNGTSPEASSERNAEDPLITDSLVQSSSNTLANAVPPQQTRTPPEEPESHAVNGKRIKDTVTAPKKRGWPKGKPRGPSVKKTTVDKPPSKRTSGRKKLNDSAKAKAALSTFSSVEKAKRQRRHSSSAVPVPAEKVKLELARRSQSVPRDVHLVIREMSQLKTGRRTNRTTAVTICAKCNRTRNSTASAGELDEWISCNGCKQWFHLDCAGFKKSHEVRDVDKYFCAPCEPTHGTTTYVRKSSRAHTSVDYAELQRGVLKTSEESNEHHYVAPIKNGTFRFDPETFPRMRPELVTRDFFERSGAFVEPICIPAEWNPRPWEMKRQLTAATGDLARDSEKDDMRAHDFEYDTVPDDGQDKLDMVMPQGLTVRNVCDLVGPDTPLDVIDVKTQNSGSKWTLSKWADYYEEDGDEKPVRNVISLEVSHTKLGRLLRRPKVVRDIDLQDAVWPREETDKGKFPKVQFYCLMSIADSYTDFHIDFGGSSVYYHVLKGKKTFLFIPPKAKHLKAYEEWNDSPQQNFTFLPDITKECYRVDLSEGDTMLIPSGWIHAVWTPETSLVIGGNFLTRMSFKNQFKVVEIEKNNETPQKFRYPHFQRIMWYTAINYLKADPLPPAVSQMFYEGQQFERVRPIWEDFDGDVAEADPRPGAKNARYYSQAEMEGLPEVANFIFRTVMLVMGRIEGISADRMRRVNASIPKGYGEPLEVAKTFALWVAWKRGNEDPPAWAHPDAMLPNSKEEGAPKKLSARAIKDLERKEAFAAFKVAPDRQSNRVQSRQAQLAAAVPAGAPAPALGNSDNATTHPDTPWIFSDRGHATASTAIPSAPSTPMHLPAQLHQEDSFASSNADAPPAAPSVIMMIGAFPGQYLSTPKSSVLGPKRVACDACRKRRIRCKHKDAVVEVVPGVTPPSHAQNGFQSSGAPDLDDDMTVASARENGQLGAYITDETNDRLENGTFSTQNGLSVHGGPGHLPTDGPRPMPGTNAYIDANIPMAMNGVSLFGDISKRSRSKACFECRKSKRRCIHDDSGNVDPVKAAENPIPRGSTTVKRSQAEDEVAPHEKKPRPIPAMPSPVQGMHGVLRPSYQQIRKKSPMPGHAWTNGSPAPGQQHSGLLAGPGDGQRLQNGTTDGQLPIDPSLTSAYPDPDDPNAYANGSYPFPTNERPQLYTLPSLEQIATEVLDMDGKGGGVPLDSGLAAIEEFNSRKDDDIHVYHAIANGAATNGSTAVFTEAGDHLDGSVDSGVSLPANGVSYEDTKSHEPEERQPNGESPVEIRHELPDHPTSNGWADGVQRSHPTDEAVTGAAPGARRNSLASIPMYQPPAAVMQSPEQTKPSLNGIAIASPAPTSPSKRKCDAQSTVPTSPAAKRAKQVNGELSSPVKEDIGDAKLAQALRKEERGLRRR